MRLARGLAALAPRRLAALAVAAFLVGLVAVYLNGQHDQLRQLRRQQRASCTVFADVGQARLITVRSSELAKKVVRDSAAAARIAGCAK